MKKKRLNCAFCSAALRPRIMHENLAKSEIKMVCVLCVIAWGGGGSNNKIKWEELLSSFIQREYLSVARILIEIFVHIIKMALCFRSAKNVFD